MARANVLRFFLMEVTNSYWLYANQTSYHAVLVLPGPRRFCFTLSGCAQMLLKLCILAGDIENNLGPDSEILIAFKELQSGQAAMLEQLNVTETKLVDHNKDFNEIKM